MLRKISIIIFVFAVLNFELGRTYSASEDARIIEEYKRQQRSNSTHSAPNLNHAQIARRLVNQANWASVGTISTNNVIKDYPMVNIISINDRDTMGVSTGHIQFLLTDLDFTGPDWQHNNKATFLFTDQQLLHCTDNWFQKIDPMEPTCARTIISGQIVKMDKNSKEYDSSIVAFVQRHPAANKWLQAHSFYLCELNITNIFVLDYYGGPHSVNVTDFYNTQP